MSFSSLSFRASLSSQETEAELEAADPPPLLVVDVALVGRAQRRRGLPVQHGHSVDGAPVLERERPRAVCKLRK